jgi:hypothetical protein
MIFRITLISVLYISSILYSQNHAVVKFVLGTVERQEKNKTVWQKLSFNGKVLEGDRIKTALNSRVELQMPDESILKIGENTIFDINEIKTPLIDKEDKMGFTLWAGNLWAKFKKVVSTRQERTLQSPSAVVAIRGTVLEMEVDMQQKTTVKVEEGMVSVRSKDTQEEVMVSANQMTVVEKGKSPTNPQTLNQQPGSEQDFVFQLDIPQLIFTDPSVLSSGIPVKGKILPGGVLSADGQPITVLQNGTVNGRVRVTEGLNEINLIAEAGGGQQERILKVYVNTLKPEIRLSSPLVSGFYNRRSYSLSGGVFDATPEDKVKVYVNNEEVAEIFARGSFNTTVILDEGANTIAVSAKDRSGNTTEIGQNLFLDTVKPILTVTNPPEQIHIRYEPPPPPSGTPIIEQDIEGIVVDPEPSSGIKRIMINGKEIKPRSDGSFSTVIRLQRGETRLEFIVEDLAGNVLRDNTRSIRVLN